MNHARKELIKASKSISEMQQENIERNKRSIIHDELDLILFKALDRDKISEEDKRKLKL